METNDKDKKKFTLKQKAFLYFYKSQQYFYNKWFYVKEKIKKFIDSLVSSEESSDDEEEACEEKESLLRILAACKIVSNEIVQLTSLLNSRLENL